MARRLWLMAILCPLGLAGCASVLDGTTQTVEVATTPQSGARCTLQNEKGYWTVPSTPGSTLVVKADGPLTVSCTRSDGAKGSTTVSSHTSLEVFGNVIVGGAIGVAEDMNSGAAYFYPKEVTVALGPGSPTTSGDVAAAPSASPPTAAASPATASEATTAVAATSAPPSAAPAPMPVAAVAPDALRQATEFCQKIDQDPRLDSLREVIALDAPPSLAMQTSTAHLTAEQKHALDAWQPLYAACRDKLMATSPEIARLFDKGGVRNRDFLSLYQDKTTVGDFNRARARDFENLRIAFAELTPPPALAAVPPAATIEPAVAHPAAGQAASPEDRPVDYCPGMNELVCVDHQHHI